MVRRIVGRLVEWALGYEHIVHVKGPLPRYGHDGDAGYDMYVSKETVILGKSIGNIPTELHIEPKEHIWFHIIGRSSTFHKRGLQVIPAVIDRGYRGEMFAAVYNPLDRPVIVREGERLAQIIPFRLIPAKFQMVEELSDSARGKNGFGSTGGNGH